MDKQRVLSQVKTIFNGKVKYLHLGCPDDFHPKSTGFKERMREVLSIAEIRCGIPAAPKLQFTNIVVDVKDYEEYVYENENGLYRTKNFADGTIIREPERPAAIFNADCHVGILYHEKTNRFALIHLGLKCFFREDGSPNIIQNAIKALGVPVSELQIWVGGGIDFCCNGYDLTNPQNITLVENLRKSGLAENTIGEEINHFKVLKDLNGFDGKVKYGPRKGQTAFNNMGMILRVLSRYCTPDNKWQNFTWILACTSCQGRERHPELPKMWSHVRKHQERNLFLAWLA